MKILCVFGKHNYGDPQRGVSYEYANFIAALRNLDYEVVHFESWERSGYRSFADLNESFVKTVERVQPDIIFCVLMHFELWLEVLETVRRKCSAIMVHWGTDDSWKYAQLSRLVASAFDLHVTTVPEALTKAKKDGVQNFFLSQWAASSVSLAEPLPASQCIHDVTFIGSAYGNRPRWISELGKRGIEVTCFGHGWPNGAIIAEEIPRIFRNSVISLNFADSGVHLGKYGFFRSRQIKARVFEVPGAGGCLLTEGAPHLSKYYSLENEIVTFNGIDSLVERINWLLANPEKRDAIARAGHARTVKEHTYERRFAQVLQFARQHNDFVAARGVGSCHLDPEFIAELRRRHEIGPVLRTFRFVLVKLFSFVFGAQRGPRAARRFIYELGWRLCGKGVFRSTGLPGRLFYRES